MNNGNSGHIRRIHNTIGPILFTGVIFIDYVKSKDNITGSANQRVSKKIIKGNGTKAHRIKGLFYKRKPNLAD